MAPTNALLVALMFVTILTIGIGNILSAMASILDQRSDLKVDWIYACWIVILLFFHLILFWETLTILEQEQWAFSWFLFILIGPMLLFLASQLVLANSVPEVPNFSRAHYFSIERRFFSVLCLLMIWLLTLDMAFGEGLRSISAWNLAGLVLFLVLAVLKNERVHAALTAISGILLLTMFVLHGTAVVV